MHVFGLLCLVVSLDVTTDRMEGAVCAYMGSSVSGKLVSFLLTCVYSMVVHFNHSKLCVHGIIYT